MRFYRLSISVDGGNSGGYHWFTSRAGAEKAKRADDALDDTGTESPGTIDVVNIQPTKPGILAALRSYAGHPDNG